MAKNENTIKLRGHHLICLHFFRGEGYSKDFIHNLHELLERVERDEIKVVEGADDVCAACPYLAKDRCIHKHDADQMIRQLDHAALRLLAAVPGEKVKWEEIRRKVLSAPDDWFSLFCRGCEWEKLCSRELN